MDDFKIKKALKSAFDDFEVSPNDDLFVKISERINEQKVERKPINKFLKYRFLGLFVLLFGLGTVYFLNENVEKIDNNQINIENIDSKITLLVKSKSSKNNIANNKNEIKNTNNIAAISLITNNIDANSIEISSPIKNNIQSKTPRIVNKKVSSNPELDQLKVLNSLETNYFSKGKSHQIKSLTGKVENDLKDENPINISTRFGNQNSEMIEKGNTNVTNKANATLVNNIKSVDAFKLFNRLKNKGLPQFLSPKSPKKELPKINKTTPLAIELGINPFYAFQKIEPTEAGLANIQNISTGNIGTKQRMGFAMNAAYVLNWTKQSRLRLGVSYRDIFQKVGYEQATDVYELQTINNQTVLVRKGLPFKEEKRNQLIGIKADRQFFLQLSTPTRFYASLGAEYTKALKGKTQMLFVNSTMGIDMPIKNKWRLQIEPSYSYALLGTTDANKFVNINPNHLGLKFGLLYEIRK